MKISIHKDKFELGVSAALEGAERINAAIEEKGEAHVVFATGASQFEMLDQLTKMKDIAWSKVTGFHLDEYVLLPETHPASFRKYLKERLLAKVAPMKDFFFIEGDKQNLEKEVEKLNSLIEKYDIDLAFVGIGENSHLAFNDPPADFDTTDPFKVVELDIDCRRQQLGEGWFDGIEDVPTKAVTMSIQQILKSKTLIVSVPDDRKSKAVKCAVEGEVDPQCPSSIMQLHTDCRLFLDQDSASLLSKKYV